MITQVIKKNDLTIILIYKNVNLPTLFHGLYSWAL